MNEVKEPLTQAKILIYYASKQCDQMLKWKVAQSFQKPNMWPQQLLLQSYLFQNSPKSHQIFRQLFVRKFVIKKFQNLPYLVTLQSSNILVHNFDHDSIPNIKKS